MTLPDLRDGQAPSRKENRHMAVIEPPDNNQEDRVWHVSHQERQLEGIAKAKANGLYKGRKADHRYRSGQDAAQGRQVAHGDCTRVEGGAV